MRFGDGAVMLENFRSNIIKRNLIYNNVLEKYDLFYRRFFNTNVSPFNTSFMNSLPPTEYVQTIFSELINGNKSFVLLRFGLYEYMLCYQYLEKQNGLRRDYSDFIKHHIHFDAGILGDNSLLDLYVEFIISNLYNVDIMAYWRNIPNTKVFSQFYNPKMIHINIDDLYPYPFLHKKNLPSWQKHLKGKKILVVSSFSKTISSQYNNREKIWDKADDILPQFELITYQAVQTNGGLEDRRFSSWLEAVNHMTNDILSINFDIALISCGGYGMPLAINLKKASKKIIQWGGCYQLWFGILGARWCNSPEIQAYINDSWVFPSDVETPPLSKYVDGSCYWKPVE